VDAFDHVELAFFEFKLVERLHIVGGDNVARINPNDKRALSNRPSADSILAVVQRAEIRAGLEVVIPQRSVAENVVFPRETT
jgi:hypothetical protein